MKRLLIVDDDKNMLRSLERRLKGRVQALTTISPRAAMKVLEQNQLTGGGNFFDALLTDLEMSEMSGLELAGMAREYGVESVTIMTGLTGIESIESCGFNVVHKPFEFQDLMVIWGLV